jgi:hypothetical protein
MLVKFVGIQTTYTYVLQQIHGRERLLQIINKKENI